MADSPKQVAALLLLPRFYEEDLKGVRKPIEENKFEKTLKEVDAKFGGATLHLAGATGIWNRAGVAVRDDEHLLAVHMPETDANLEWWREYVRTVLCERFDQDAMYISFPEIRSELIPRERIVRKK